MSGARRAPGESDKLRRDRRLDRWFMAAAVLAAGFLYFFRVPAPRKELRSAPPLALEERGGGLYAADPASLPEADVLEVVDGDTLRVSWEGRSRALRYFAVDTPERNEACYDGARRRNAALAGRRVRLGFDARREDPNGRLLAYVFSPEGRSLEADLIAEGWGRAWTSDGRFRELFADFETVSRMEKVGCLWEDR